MAERKIKNPPKPADSPKIIHGMADMKAMDKAYAQLFNSRGGQLVLKDLRRQFYDTPMTDNATLERMVGRRDVIFHINQRLTRNGSPTTK